MKLRLFFVALIVSLLSIGSCTRPDILIKISKSGKIPPYTPPPESFNFVYDCPSDNEITGRILEVGPGREYTDLSTVPFNDLTGDDLVKIYYRAEPYRSLINLRCKGTADKPVRIYGIPDSHNNLPVISGEDATIGPSMDGNFDQWTQGLGVFVIYGGWGNKPHYIEIANLKIMRARSDFTYTYYDDPGTPISYGNGSSGFWILADNISIKGCIITENGNGVFSQANETNDTRITYDLLVEGCKIYDNGVVGSDRQHNLYVQGGGMTVQFNYIGNLITGAYGSSYKDRCAGTVFRYNFLKSSARALDLVEPEGPAETLTGRDDFDETHVYGNIILNDHIREDAGAGNMIHYGGDSGITEVYRNGTLYFYNNTVYINSNLDNSWRMHLFDVSLNTARVELYNNIIYKEGTTNFYLLRNEGTVYVGPTNWITTGYGDNSDTASNPGTVTTSSNGVITGADPGFFDVTNDDFSLTVNSECLSQAAGLPSVITSVYPVTHQYDSMTRGKIRTSTADPGALE